MPCIMPSKMVHWLFTKLFEGLQCANVYRDIQIYKRERERIKNFHMASMNSKMLYITGENPYFITLQITHIYIYILAKVKSLGDICISNKRVFLFYSKSCIVKIVH